MKRIVTICALALGVGACGDGNPFTDTVAQEADADTSAGSAFQVDEAAFLRLNNIIYDDATDTLVLNNIPFDDPDNIYVRIGTEAFSNGFDAYESDPDRTNNEVQYFAIFQRSASGESQVASVGTTEYVDFGYGGTGAQRLGVDPNFPTLGIFGYTGEYGAVRVTLNTGASGENELFYVTGVANLTVDYDDFDDTGAVGGTIDNRVLYDVTGAVIDESTLNDQATSGVDGSLISLTDTTIDFDTGIINEAAATEVDSTGTSTNTGTWTGVFAGSDAEEIAGSVVVDSGTVREVGGFIAIQDP